MKGVAAQVETDVAPVLWFAVQCNFSATGESKVLSQIFFVERRTKGEYRY
jgi:hypothetical protein